MAATRRHKIRAVKDEENRRALSIRGKAEYIFDLIDETYDEIEDDKVRWSKACMEIKRLSSKSLPELHSWYYSDDTQSKLKHNVHVAKKLSWNQIDRLSSLIKELDNI